MEILIAAVVLSAGLVAAAALMGRTRSAPSATPVVADGPPAKAEPARRARPAAAPDDAARRSELDTRENELGARERALQRELQQLAARREELQRALERVSGLSAAQAKAMLLKEIEDDA